MSASSGLNINAKEWISGSSASSNISKSGKIICQFFAMGGCRFGGECPYSHELTQEAPEGVDSSAGFFISGRVANLGSNSTPSCTANEKHRPQVSETGGHNQASMDFSTYNGQRPDVYRPPSAPVDLSQSSVSPSYVQSGNPPNNYVAVSENAFRHPQFPQPEPDHSQPAQQFYHQQQVHQQMQTQPHGFTMVHGPSHGDSFHTLHQHGSTTPQNHAPISVLYNNPTCQPSLTQYHQNGMHVSGETGFSPTYPQLVAHSGQQVFPQASERQFVTLNQSSQGVPSSSFQPPQFSENVPNTPAQLGQTIYYHAETGSYVVRQQYSNSQVQLTRAASYPLLHNQQVQQQQYFVSANPAAAKHQTTTPTSFTSTPTQSVYPQQAAQHHAAPFTAPNQLQTVTMPSGTSPTVFQQQNFQTSGYQIAGSSYQHPTVQVGGPGQNGNGAHAAFFNNNNEAIRQSYQAPPNSQFHSTSGNASQPVLEYVTYQSLYDSRRASGSSVREEVAPVHSGGSSPLPPPAVAQSHTLVNDHEMVAPAFQRAAPPVVPKSIDEDVDDVASALPPRGKNGRLMMAPTPLS